MNGVSRDERKKTFTFENEQEFAGKQKPGPGEYENFNPRYQFGNKLYSIPKTARFRDIKKSHVTISH